MYQDQHVAWYVQRQLGAYIDDAIPALDLFALHASLRPTSPYARLLASPVPHSGQAPPQTPTRSFTGHLRLGTPGPALPIEVNLGPWSRTTSAVGIRPASRRPPAVRHARYFTRTQDLLDDFILKLDLLTHLAGGPRSDTARHYARVLVASPATPTVTDHAQSHRSRY
jgi:hypothetical protein